MNNKNQSKMKQIKFLIAIALVSVIAISCKETKKEEVKDAVEAVEETTTEVKEEVEVVVDSLLNSDESNKARREKLMSEAEQPYVKIVLKTLALNGDVFHFVLGRAMGLMETWEPGYRVNRRREGSCSPLHRLGQAGPCSRVYSNLASGPATRPKINI